MDDCLSCGAPQNAEGLLYCVKCGKRLEPPAPPPESWRYSDDLNRTQVNQPGPQPFKQPGPQPSYQPPPAYQNYPPQAPQQVQPIYAPASYTSASPYQPQYPAAAAAPQTSASNSLPQIGMTMSIVVACIMLLGLVPCLGWMNWFVLIVGKITLILCVVGLATEKDPVRRNKAVIGLVIAATALGVGFVRLLIGGGCL